MLDQRVVEAISDVAAAKRERRSFTRREISLPGDVLVEVFIMLSIVFVRATSTKGEVLSKRFIDELRAEGEREGSFVETGGQQLASVREFSLIPTFRK